MVVPHPKKPNNGIGNGSQGIYRDFFGIGKDQGSSSRAVENMVASRDENIEKASDASGRVKSFARKLKFMVVNDDIMIPRRLVTLSHGLNLA